jgi:hypothetical protein
MLSGLLGTYILEGTWPSRSRSDDRCLGVMGGFELCRWDHADLSVEAPVVERVDVLESLALDVIEAAHCNTVQIGSTPYRSRWASIYVVISVVDRRARSRRKLRRF